MSKRNDPTEALIMLRSMEIPLVLPVQHPGPRSRWWLWLLVSLVAIIMTPLIIVLGARQTALTVAKTLSRPAPSLVAGESGSEEDLPITITIKQPVDSESDGEEADEPEPGTRPDEPAPDPMPALVIKPRPGKKRRVRRNLGRRAGLARKARPAAVDADALLLAGGGR